MSENEMKFIKKETVYFIRPILLWSWIMICVKHKNVDRRTVHYNSDREKFKIIYYFVNVHRTFSNICPQDNDGKWGLASETKTAEWKKRRCFTKKIERVLFADMT